MPATYGQVSTSLSGKSKPSGESAGASAAAVPQPTKPAENDAVTPSTTRRVAALSKLRACVRAVHASAEPVESARRAPSSKIESLSYESAENELLGYLARSAAHEPQSYATNTLRRARAATAAAAAVRARNL